MRSTAKLRVSWSCCCRRGDELLQIVDGAEDVVPVRGQHLRHLRNAGERVVDLLALAAQVGRAGLQEPGQRAVLVGAIRAQCGRKVIDVLEDLVEFLGHLGTRQRDDAMVGEHRTPVVDGRQLHGPVRDQRGRQDHGRGICRDGLLGRVGEVDPHLLAFGDHRGHAAHLDPEDVDVRPRVEVDGTREIGGAVLLARSGQGHLDQRHEHDEGNRAGNDAQHPALGQRPQVRQQASLRCHHAVVLGEALLLLPGQGSSVRHHFTFSASRPSRSPRVFGMSGIGPLT